MGNQNPAGFRRNAEHFRVEYTDNPTVVSTQKIDRRFPAAKAHHDLVVEIGVRLESRSHGRAYESICVRL